jgi:hypothetical protein
MAKVLSFIKELLTWERLRWKIGGLPDGWRGGDEEGNWFGGCVRKGFGDLLEDIEFQGRMVVGMSFKIVKDWKKFVRDDCFVIHHIHLFCSRSPVFVFYDTFVFIFLFTFLFSSRQGLESREFSGALLVKASG